MKKHLALGILLFLSMSTTILGFFGLADIIQWVVNFPETFTFWVFNNRFYLIGVGGISLIASLAINYKYQIISKWIMGGLVFLILTLSISGFVGPTYVMFRSQQLTAEYVSQIDVNVEYLTDLDEVMVLTNNGDVRAFPNKWIVQTHIAGDKIGGDDIVMTHCGLSHVGQAYKSTVDGEPINLKVMTQLENNLVMFDARSQEPLLQIRGEMLNSNKRLGTVATTVMSYGSFRNLYPEGLVYYFMPDNFVEKMVYRMLDDVIYSAGGQYDKSTPNLSFNTLSHKDDRLHSKEQVYAVEINDETIAYTKEYLVNHGNAIVDVIGGEQLTIKYFEDYDFVNIYFGNAEYADPYGNDGEQSFETVPHFNRILWSVWANFHPDTELKS